MDAGASWAARARQALDEAIATSSGGQSDTGIMGASSAGEAALAAAEFARMLRVEGERGASAANPAEADASANPVEVPGVEYWAGGHPRNECAVGGPPRPNRNPLQVDLCIPIPFGQRYLGPCGHPGCGRPADYVGVNRVCDFCGAYDPDCTLFSCSDCKPSPVGSSCALH